MTQEGLANEADLPRNHIGLIERNRTSLTIEMLLKLCRVRDVRASDLVRRIE